MTYPIYCYDEADRYKFDAADCVIRAFKITLDIPYSLSSWYWRTHSKFTRRGVWQFTDRLRELERDGIGKLTMAHYAFPIADFLETCDKNKRYVVSTLGHAFAVKHGKIFDSTKDAGPTKNYSSHLVESIFEVKERT